jgi:hypothetical protein
MSSKGLARVTPLCEPVARVVKKGALVAKAQMRNEEVEA